jgi:hypothetical protein
VTPFDGFTFEEHETLVSIDYAVGQVVLYTTLGKVWEGWELRFAGINGAKWDRKTRTARLHCW